MCPDDDSRLITNPRLVAIQAVKEQATTSRGRLAEATSTSGTAADKVADGLTEDVWTSPVADDYRTKISDRVSDTGTAIEDIVRELTDAENEIYDDQMDMVTDDSPEARWPSS